MKIRVTGDRSMNAEDASGGSEKTCSLGCCNSHMQLWYSCFRRVEERERAHQYIQDNNGNCITNTCSFPEGDYEGLTI